MSVRDEARALLAALCESVPESEGVYVLHFSSKLHHAGHYSGSAKNLRKRVRKHATSPDARLMQVIKEKGITFVVGFYKVGPARAYESLLKRSKNAPKKCHVCKGVALSPQGVAA